MKTNKTINVTIKASGGETIYKGDVEDMPTYDRFVDVYEEAVNQGKDSGETGDWKWTATRNA